MICVAADGPSAATLALDMTPNRIFDSPFLSADYVRGIVTIVKGNRKKMLNLN